MATAHKSRRSREVARSAVTLTAAEHGHKRLLADFNVADSLHSFLAFFLFLEQFAFTRNITAITLCGDILAHRRHGLPRDDPRSDSRLHRDLKHVAFDLGF